jgi:hypothetical protein
MGTCYLASGVAGQVDGKRSNLVCLDEFMGGLSHEDNFGLYLLLGHAASLGGIRDLPFNEGRQHIARADRINGYSEFGELKRSSLG